MPQWDGRFTTKEGPEAKATPICVVLQELDAVPGYLLRLPRGGYSLSLGDERVQTSRTLTSPEVISQPLCVKIKCGPR